MSTGFPGFTDNPYADVKEEKKDFPLYCGIQQILIQQVTAVLRLYVSAFLGQSNTHKYLYEEQTLRRKRPELWSERGIQEVRVCTELQKAQELTYFSQSVLRSLRPTCSPYTQVLLCPDHHFSPGLFKLRAQQIYLWTILKSMLHYKETNEAGSV